MLAALLLAAVASAAAPTNPILFVTQVPLGSDFASVASTFGNQTGEIDAAPKGGDLWIRYPDGTLKNLTRAAGYGVDGMQDERGIAVREPSVHWSGTKALFSMVVGAPPRQYEWGEHYWQIYEIIGLGASETPVIRKIPNQPPSYNNVSPFYGTDERILFTSDRPRNGARHLYPQLDEYEEASTVTGIWSLDPGTGDLRLLNHTPSGAFTPFIDSFGRVIFTRWDHLQRDQQADADAQEGSSYGTFDYADESETAAKLSQRVEVFPEPRASRTDLLAGTNLEGNSINHFFPWEINEDGTSEETLNHIGRHELHGYFNRSFNDDPKLVEFIDDTSGRMNANEVENLFQIKEDPTHAGRYFAVDSPEFATHASGRIISLTAEPSRPADQIQVEYVTARADATHYRDPLPLSNGTLLAVHASETRDDANDGTTAQPTSRYQFRIKTLELQNGSYVAGAPLTSGIHASLTWWSPDVLVTWSGDLWELHPVEVRARTRPATRTTPLEEPEARVFREEGVDPQRFRNDLIARNLAVIVSRDVTSRDNADKQQPFNLRVAGGSAAHVTSTGKTYEISRMQLYQAEQLRGVGGIQSPKAGRRVLARPAGGTAISPDGSIAMLVPARRAMSWQTTDASGTPVVRERYWLTFQPGEVRVCASCHGVNTHDQLGQPPPQHSPEALRALLKIWKQEQTPEPAKRRAVRK
jgi:hydrazine synthase alpha subunit-like protein